LADTPFLVPVTIALLGEGLWAKAARERFELVVRPNMILHIGHLAESFQANFALSSLVESTGLFIEHLHSAPQLFLTNDFRICG